jgi:hypothetical protein
MSNNDKSEFPVNEMQHIQEALKPLKYIVRGFKEGKISGNIILYLKYDYPFVPVTNSQSFEKSFENEINKN